MKRFFIAAIALMAMVACSKDDTVSVLDTTKKSVSIDITNILTPTKAVTDTAGATNVACTKAEDLVFGFCDAAGNLVVAKDINDAVKDPVTGHYVFHAMSQKISRLYIIANGAGASKITKTNAPANYQLAHDLWNVQTPDVEWDEIIVFGHSSITHLQKDGKDVFCEVEGKKYPLFGATVKVVPNHARLEISKIACSDLGKEYKKIALRSMTFAGTFTEVLGDATTGFVFDATATPAVTSLTAGTGKVWSWNIKPMIAPDLVLNIDALEGNGWSIPDGTAARTVTVADYKPSGIYTTSTNLNADGFIKEFLPGEIYQLNLTFKELNMHNDSDALCVDVDVQIAQWVIVPIDPVFQ